MFRANCPDLRNADLKIRQQFKQKSFEGFVGPVNFIYEKDRRSILFTQRLKQRPFEKELTPKNVFLFFLDALAAFFLNFDRQQLPLVIPLIDRCINIQPFVALKANQAHIQEGRQNLGYLSLAQASVPFQKNGLAQLDQQQDGYGESAITDVSQLLKASGYLVRVFQMPARRQRWSRHDDWNFTGPAVPACPPLRNRSCVSAGLPPWSRKRPRKPH